MIVSLGSILILVTTIARCKVAFKCFKILNLNFTGYIFDM